jgi:hypothetical protein
MAYHDPGSDLEPPDPEAIRFLDRENKALDRENKKKDKLLNRVAENFREKGNALKRTVVLQGTSALTGLALGVAGQSAHRVPYDLIGGVLVGGAGYCMSGTKAAVAIAMSDAMVASYMNNAGYMIGDLLRNRGKSPSAMRMPRSLPPGRAVQLPAGGPAPAAVAGMSPHQMADIVARVRGAARHDHL